MFVEKTTMRTHVFTLLLLFAGLCLQAQQEINYDEAKVPDYTLPELLATAQGKAVKTVRQWERRRRPELLDLFAAQMDGRTPDDGGITVRYELLAEHHAEMGGK